MPLKSHCEGCYGSRASKEGEALPNPVGTWGRAVQMPWGKSTVREGMRNEQKADGSMQCSPGAVKDFRSSDMNWKNRK